MKKIISSTFIALLIFLPSTLYAQVTISPTNLFIDGNSQFGTYMVINGSNETQEIAIDFFFAYSQSNENGDKSIIDEDAENEQKHSISEHVRAFPRNFTLAPGQRQTVRLRVSAPTDLEDGTYWSRIKTSSTPETPPLEVQNNSAVTARVGIKVEQITGLFYKKGTTTTGIQINGINPIVSEDGNSLNVLVDVLRTGNSPFLGSITTSILNIQGQEVRTGFVSTSIYFDSIFKQIVDIEGLPAGTYQAIVNFETTRSDIPSNRLVQMPMISETISFSIR